LPLEPCQPLLRDLRNVQQARGRLHDLRQVYLVSFHRLRKAVDVASKQLHRLGEGFVTFHQPVEPFVNVHAVSPVAGAKALFISALGGTTEVVP